MSQIIGHTFNKVLGRQIPIILAGSTPDFWRPVESIASHLREMACKKCKTAFENRRLFKEKDMANMTRLTITYSGFSDPLMEALIANPI